MDFVLGIHETRAARAFEVIDTLVSIPTSDSLDRLRGSLPQNLITLNYFFEKAGPEWIPVLQGTPYLQPDEVLDLRGRYAPWPAADWAIRVSGADTAFARGTLDRLASTSNPLVASAALSVAESLDTAELASRGGQLAHWARVSAGFSDGRVATRIIVRLSSDGASEASLLLANAVLGGTA
jgi:hypothetical protein